VLNWTGLKIPFSGKIILKKKTKQISIANIFEMLNTKTFCCFLAIPASQFLQNAEEKYPKVCFEKHMTIKRMAQFLCHVVSLKYLHILVVS